MVDEISTGSVEQSHGIQQIGHAISQMEQTTQTSVAHAEQGAAAAQLNAQADSMKELVGRMRIMVEGESSAAREPQNGVPVRPRARHHRNGALQV